MRATHSFSAVQLRMRHHLYMSKILSSYRFQPVFSGAKEVFTIMEIGGEKVLSVAMLSTV